MQQIMITPDISAAIMNLATQLDMSENELIKQAICEYAEKMDRKKRLMSFAGALSETDADNLLRTIRDSRVNKSWDLDL